MVGLVLAAFAATLIVVVGEIRTSTFQARYFTEQLQGADWTVVQRPSDSIIFPTHGPYDVRNGYVRIPEVTRRLQARGFELTDQAQWSDQLRRLVTMGAFPPYVEKRQTGLDIVDARGEPLYAFSTPRDVYATFEDIPQIIVKTLLFIENRTLLEFDPPTRNPAIEWKRLANAVVENALEVVGMDSGRPSGGSTLATQVEKFRHSPDGRTQDAEEKLRQIASASLRAYLDGPDTAEARKRIILDYINGVPLSANPKAGEVFGLRDALHVWFSVDPNVVDLLLTRTDISTWQEKEARGLAYRQVLTLILAERRPSELLLERRDALDEIVDSHLRVMREEGVIPMELADEALAMRSMSVDLGALPESVDYASVKTQVVVREQIRGLVGERSLHTLDRMDLNAQSTLELSEQQRIKEKLLSLRDAAAAQQMGLVGNHLLKHDAQGIVFSFTLYERTPMGSALRLQVDTFEQPLNINEGVKLDLGSTAKLRTLATYLEIVADLHAGLSALSVEQRESFVAAPDDELTKWVLAQLRKRPEIELAELLDAAMLRTYSASPQEVFFTGGGAHRFNNFDKSDNGRRVSARDSFRQSINLPFVRMMREIVRFHLPRLPNAGPTLFTDPTHRGRKPRLEQFVEAESEEYLRRFWQRYRNTTPDDALTKLIAKRKQWTPVSLATALRSAAPDMEFDTFSETVLANVERKQPNAEKMQKLYDDHGPGKFDWNDRGYLTRVHPLELWLIAYRRVHGEPDWVTTLAAASEIRRSVYEWLFKPSKFKAQNNRIRTILEQEAFVRIHESWVRLGYPFDEVTPSLATSIGAAGDRPDALARLVGVIAGGGLALDRFYTTSLHFAAGTPYETRFERAASEPTQVMKREVADQLRRELVGVVEFGTARRLRRAEPFKSDPRWLVGGKTGTGDHRRKRVDRAGRVLEEVPVSRSATFVFFLGDRFHGTITTFVEGEAAAQHSFTSSLPVTLLRELSSELEPIVGPMAVGPAKSAAVQPTKEAREFTDGVMFYEDVSEPTDELVIY